MKKFTSLFLVMILGMSVIAQKIDTIKTKTSTDTVVIVQKARKNIDERKEQKIDTTITDSSGNKMHVKMHGKDVLIIQNEDGTTRVNVSKDKNKKSVTLHVDTDSNSNYDANYSDTTRIRIGKLKFLVVDDDNNNQISFENDDSDKNSTFEGHFSGIDIGLNNYFTSDFSTSLPANEEYLNLNTGKSWGLNVNFIQQSIGLVKNNIGLVTGLGIEFNNYRFDNRQMVLSGDSTVLYAHKDTQHRYEKNKLVTTYLTVPLLMEFQIHVGEKSKPIFLSFGATGSVKIGSHIKLKTDGGNKTKDRDDFNLSPLRYGLSARVGYGALNFFANYSLQPMFEKGKGPELYPFTIGLTLLYF